MVAIWQLQVNDALGREVTELLQRLVRDRNRLLRQIQYCNDLQTKQSHRDFITELEQLIDNYLAKTDNVLMEFHNDALDLSCIPYFYAK